MATLLEKPWRAGTLGPTPLTAVVIARLRLATVQLIAAPIAA